MTLPGLYPSRPRKPRPSGKVKGGATPAPTPERVALAQKLLDRWRDDPVAFAREALGTEPWDRQADILRAVPESPRVAVRSGHKIGKSRAAAILAHWWVATRPGAWVVMTSSSARQVKAILWHEFRLLYTKSRVRLGPDPALEPSTGYALADGRRVQGFSTDKPERMAGISGQNVLFILDEASGIPEPIFEAIEGNRAGGARIVMFSNPTQTVGTFYDAFHAKREFWRTFKLSSEDTPNARAGRVIIPGLATAEWVDEKRREWGTESPIYAVRVKGDFPAQGSDVVVALAWLTQAQDIWPTTPTEGDLAFGVDPARYGDDDSVIAARRGKKILPLQAFTGLDGIQLAGRVVEAVRSLRRTGEPKPQVKIDVIGVGASCADQLKQHRDILDVIEVNVSEAATSENYHRLRDQLWFAAAEWLKEGGALPPDDKLAGELVAPHYGFDAQGRYQVESKDETKKRLKRSPNHADAVCLAIYQARRSLRPLGAHTGGSRRAMDGFG